MFRDLRPYVCTFEDCLNAEKLYLGRHDWTYHELQIHRRQYVCRDCQKTFDGKTDMTRHLREHYAEASTTHLGIILDLCDDQVDVSSTKDSCIFCGEEHFLVALHEHVAEHMESISLFILPGMTRKAKPATQTSTQGVMLVLAYRMRAALASPLPVMAWMVIRLSAFQNSPPTRVWVMLPSSQVGKLSWGIANPSFISAWI